MLSEEKLKIAAYKLCELRGEKPEADCVKMEVSSDGIVYMKITDEKKWQHVALEIRPILLILDAINYANDIQK